MGNAVGLENEGERTDKPLHPWDDLVAKLNQQHGRSGDVWSEIPSSGTIAKSERAREVLPGQRVKKETLPGQSDYDFPANDKGGV